MRTELAEAVERVSRVVEGHLGRPVIRASVSIEPLAALDARYRFPRVFREFLAEGASDDFGASGPELQVGRWACRLTTGASFEALHRAYEGIPDWPSAWLVCAHEDEGCYFLDSARVDASGDCPVFHLDHGAGLDATPCAPTFVEFLERIAAESRGQPSIRERLEEYAYAPIEDAEYLAALDRLAERFGLPFAFVEWMRHWDVGPGSTLVPLAELEALQSEVRARVTPWPPEWFAIARAEHEVLHVLWLGSRNDDDAEVWAVPRGAPMRPERVARSFVRYLFDD